MRSMMRSRRRTLLARSARMRVLVWAWAARWPWGGTKGRRMGTNWAAETWRISTTWVTTSSPSPWGGVPLCLASASGTILITGPLGTAA